MQAYHSHRRGLSLDAGLLGRGHYTPSQLLISPSLPQFLDIAHQHNERTAVQRPSTPQKQIGSDSLPLTPTTTPFRRSNDFYQNSKSVQHSPTRRQARRNVHTNNSTSMQRTKSLQGVIGSNFTQPKTHAPSPTSTAFFDSFDSFTSQLPDLGDDVFSDFTFHHAEDSRNPAVSFDAPSSPVHSSFTSQQQAADAAYSGVSNDSSTRPKVPIMPAVPLISTSHRTANSTPCSSPQKAPISPRPVSIADLNLGANIDASIEETGVTIDDIAAFIEGPDAVDKKWVCTYEGCNKRFGRKENIKSHVQTHLGDRQFKCNHCNKCFVRGHDLKRHAKIHTGIKPYPCECGNSFARQDALTRHKQRGMCSGAFKGAVRKVVKRGRPRKHRPEVDERQDKANRTRIAASEKSYASSVSESSCVSVASPPSETNDGGSVQTSSPGDDMQYLHSDGFGLPPDVFTFTPPASPGFSTGNVPSPTRSFRSMTPTMERNFLSLSPTKRPLDDIPEEIPDIPLIRTSSPTPVRKERHVSSQFLLPSPAEPTFADANGPDFDVFASQSQETATTASISTLDHSQLASLELPSAVGGLSTDTGDVGEYEPELFLTTSSSAQRDDNAADMALNAQFFSGSFSQYSDDFFHSFSTEVNNEM
ncbi:hypothetical protein AJ79_02399 [Helicocarpus griseus UAMH5409]|uniref:C2H2 type master regulator of conidiophore development brlA n=1 Tax=Helicocarpus griseus UAMH5409 TaxID=1447875 RepID=A0A2B7Y315_9EURO|nr:hypothetical protein AJ79_02399 [Helicocarpus griseus UAMH5409]